jgi:ATP-binding protein involved in chromosome partitioning
MELPVVEAGDAGRPVVLTAPQSASGQAFQVLARQLSERCSISPAPR